MRRLTDSTRFGRVLDWLDTHLPASPWIWQWAAVQTVPWLPRVLVVVGIVAIGVSLLTVLDWLWPDGLFLGRAW